MLKFLNLFFILLPCLQGANEVSMDTREPFSPTISPIIVTASAETTSTSTSTDDIVKYYNRDEYIRQQIDALIQEDKDLNTKVNCTGIIANMLTTASAVTTSTILAISVVGATEYMDPRLANVISSCGAGLNGLLMWSSLQFKKKERFQIERQKMIRQALGLPTRLILPDLSSSFEQFKSP